MSIYDATFALIDALDEAKIPYMLSGSLSSMYYSFPRATTDADFVIDLGETPIADLGETLRKGFHLDPQLTFEMLGGTTKHVVDVLGTPFKIELFRLSSTPFDQSRFARRIKAKLLDRDVWLPTAEDVILQKLSWNRPKDREDILGVMIANHSSLDRGYLSHWCDELNIRVLFAQMWSEAQELGDE